MFLLDDQLMDAAMQRFVHLITTESDMRPDQVEVNIPTLLRSCSVKLLFNLILSLGSDDSVLRRRARSALLTVRNIIGVSGPEARHDVSAIVQTSVDNMKSIGAADSPRRDGRRKGVHKVVDRQLADFLSNHVLGILAYMNEVLQDADSTTATSGGSNSVKHYRSEQSRRQALRAMGDLAVLLGSHAALYTNNIVASLSPSLVSPLASVTLESWGLLAESLSSVSLTADQLNSLIVPLLSTFLVSASDRS
ncbi:hypothetical protein FBU59_004638 [Linderina macrospora]|uniref:Uncharacterized protein n=1 Tax=Linderina macrospora TaxID=4868 RepID=A0ACC1J556_9FUNG|nr:hypothetical protein FBU59_004638 [Linderina macrospora]